MKDTNPDLRRNRFGWAARFLILVISLTAALCIVESILAWKIARRAERELEKPRPVYTWMMHTRDGKKMGTRKGILKLCLDTYTGYRILPNQKTEKFTINSHGFRGEEVDRKKSDRKRIMLVGGSAAFGTGLKSDSEAFAAHLESLLPGTEVINAAVIGFHSKQELVLVASELVFWKPDLIIALDGWNDWVFNTCTSGIFVNETEDLLLLAGAMNTDDWIDRVKRLPHLLFPATCRWAKGRFEHEGAVKDPEDPNEVRKAFAENVAAMDQAGRSCGSRFLSILQIDTGDRSVNMYKHEGQSYNKFCKHAGIQFDRKGVEWMDMNLLRDHFDPGLFIDRIHLNTEGYRVMAELAAEKIMAKGLLEPLPE